MVILELIHAEKAPRGVVFIRLKTVGFGHWVNHDNCSERMALRRRRFIQIPALSAFDGSVVDYHGGHG